MSFDLVGRIKIRDDGASKVIDKVTRALQIAERANKQLTSASDRLRTSQSRLYSQNTKSARSFESVQNAIKKTDGIFTNFAKKAAKGITFGAVGLGAITAGAAAYGVVSSAKKAMDFEAQLSTIQALTGATNAEMAKMQDLALKVGADTKYNALEAAQGIEELLKAGLTPATVQAGGLEAALNLATAGGLELAEAAEIMSTGLNSFKKDGLKAADAANILAGTANASATDVHDLRYSLAAVGSVADGVGLSFRDTNAALGVFANNGLKGSDAGTSLKSMLMNLSPATKDAYEVMRALGIITKDGTNRFYDANKELKSTAEIAEILHKSLKNLSAKDRQDVMRAMFGSDGIRGANILFKEGAKGVEEFIKEMSKVTALDVAKKKMDNAAGAVEQFRGAIETLQISALMPTMPLIKDFANSAANFVEKYTPQITAGIEKLVNKAKSYLKTHFINNPEFKKLPDLKSKIKFVFDDLMGTFNQWYESEGRARLTAISQKTVDTIAGALKASQPLIDAAVKIGVSIGQGLLQGILSDPTLAMILGGGVGAKLLGKFGGGGAKTATTVAKTTGTSVLTNPYVLGAAGLTVAAGAEASIWENVKHDPNSIYSSKVIGGGTTAPKKMIGQPVPSKKITEKQVDSLANYFTGKGHAGGLDRVPYNNYPARLHKDEMVLTKTEASNYRNENGATGKSRPFTINIQSMVVREDADIERIAKRLAYEMAK